MMSDEDSAKLPVSALSSCDDSDNSIRVGYIPDPALTEDDFNANAFRSLDAIPEIVSMWSTHFEFGSHYPGGFKESSTLPELPDDRRKLVQGYRDRVDIFGDDDVILPMYLELKRFDVRTALLRSFDPWEFHLTAGEFAELVNDLSRRALRSDVLYPIDQEIAIYERYSDGQRVSIYEARYSPIRWQRRRERAAYAVDLMPSGAATDDPLPSIVRMADEFFRSRERLIASAHYDRESLRASLEQVASGFGKLLNRPREDR